MKKLFWPIFPTLLVSALGLVAAAAEPAPPPSPYEVVWDSPSQDYNGTMPLGNGEVALNAWLVPVTSFDAGANVPGRRARFIRVETKNEAPRELLLRRITVFGVK